MNGIYKVNLVCNDLSTEETILQIADTLDNLNGIVNDVFSRLTKRINKNKEKNVELQRRIQLCNDKVAKLSGVQKAIKVFSNAKYPPSVVHNNYQSVFDLDCYRHEPVKTILRSSQRTDDKAVRDKLHFYHVKVGQPQNAAMTKTDMKQKISQATTVGELLIYNTDECPYIPMVRPIYRPTVSTVETKDPLEAAPTSITKREVLNRDDEHYLYAPGMEYVPELDVPLHLPDLPGVADDIQFQQPSDTVIAPSALTSPVTPQNELPSEVPVNQDNAIFPDIPAALPDIPAALPDIPAVLPDIPDAAPVPVKSAPPPPPPPPPPPEEVPMEKIERTPPAPRPAAPAGDARSNLMEAIRKAGGAGKARLKSTNVATEKPPPSGGLMADLHAKLTMRRRGISGDKGSLMQTLADVIPEPEESSQPSSSGEDWE